MAFTKKDELFLSYVLLKEGKANQLNLIQIADKCVALPEEYLANDQGRGDRHSSSWNNIHVMGQRFLFRLTVDFRVN